MTSSDWYEGKINEPLVRLELEKRRADCDAEADADVEMSYWSE